MISIFKQFLRQSRGSLKMTLPLKASSSVRTAWIQTKLIGAHRCLYHHSSRGFLDFFKKDKKSAQNNPEIFRKQMEELLEKVKAEHQVEPREEAIFDIFRLFNEAKLLEQQTSENICGGLGDIINEIETIVDSRDDWIQEDSYQIKFLLLQAYLDAEDEPRVQRYCDEFMDPRFLGEVFEKLDGELKVIFTLIFGELMLNRNQSQYAINLVKTFLEQLQDSNDDYPVSLPVRQRLYAILIQAHKHLNQHPDAFQDIEEVISIVNSKDYFRDVSWLRLEEVKSTFSIILNLMEYCFSYQQYNHAFRLGDSLLAHLNSPDYKEFSENLAYSVNILKNLDKHYKTLLGLNKQLAKQQPLQEEKATGAAAEIEEKYLKSFEKFLGFQSEFIQHCNIKSSPIYSQPLIEDTLHRLSSEGKHALLKISHKYDCLSV